MDLVKLTREFYQSIDQTCYFNFSTQQINQRAKIVLKRMF